MGMATEIGAELSKRACTKSEGPKKKEKTLPGTGNHLEAAEYLEHRENSGRTQTQTHWPSRLPTCKAGRFQMQFQETRKTNGESTAHLLEQNYSLVSDSEDTAIRFTK